MRLSRVVMAGAGLAAAGVAAAAAVQRRPPLPADEDSFFPIAGPPADGNLRCMFLGNSTILITDGESSILTDGFVSRPGLVQVGTRTIGPKDAEIRKALNLSGIRRLDAVICAHSHYDHAMDAPVVAELTGATVIGSDSTLNIARGYGLGENQLRATEVNRPFVVGNFEIELRESIHSPKGKFVGFIESPLAAPARASCYRMAECYSIIIRHLPAEGDPNGTVVVHASANFLPGVLEGVTANTVFLGITLIGKQGEQFRESYWNETVRTVGARNVIPVHWDDFFRPLSEPLVPLPYLADDFPRAWADVKGRAASAQLVCGLPRLWEWIDPA